MHGHPRAALQFLNNSPQDRFLRAVCYRHIGDIEAAKNLLSEILESSDPGVPMQSAWNSYGMVMSDLGNFPYSIACFRKALAFLDRGLPTPDYNVDQGRRQIEINLAQALLRMGNFEEAWPLWESTRYGLTWQSPLVPWSGQPGRVLVLSEGGYGDQFLFSRWVKDIAVRSSAQLTYYIHEDLINILLRELFVPMIQKPRSADRTPEVIPNINWDRFDFATSVLSLPAICGMKSLADIPNGEWRGHPGYIPVDAPVGLCWESEEIGVQRKTRSIPVSEFEVLRQHVSLVTMCPGRPHPNWMWPSASRSWNDTAEQLVTLDCLVTVDTAVAHLAGCLNVPTYLILPVASDWKYFTRGMVGNQSPWYRSVKLIRNTDPYSFKPAIEMLMEEMRKDGRF